MQALQRIQQLQPEPHPVSLCHRAGQFQLGLLHVQAAGHLQVLQGGPGFGMQLHGFLQHLLLVGLQLDGLLLHRGRGGAQPADTALGVCSVSGKACGRIRKGSAAHDLAPGRLS